jgi:Spy/CpxP family protein refolding chaperone
MIMKRNVAAAIAMMIATTIYAQQKENVHPRHQRGESMSKVLSLDDEQTETIKGIHKKYADKFGAIRMDSTMSREDKRSAGHSLRNEKDAEIKSILTPEQNKKWRTYETERAEQRKEQREKFMKEHEARMKTELSLSDDQAAKMKSANENFKTKIQELKKDDKADREAFKKLKSEHESTIKSILSEDQFKKWKDHKSEMHKKGRGKRK